MMRHNIRYASVDDLQAARLMRSMATHANPRLNLGSALLGGYVLFLGLFLAWMLTGPPAQVDFTDTGVGCIDDCLDPMIEDEADEPVSIERN